MLLSHIHMHAQSVYVAFAFEKLHHVMNREGLDAQ